MAAPERIFDIPESLLAAAIQLLRAATFPGTPSGTVTDITLQLSQLQPQPDAEPLAAPEAEVLDIDEG